MYNRYIRKADGSFERTQVPEPVPAGVEGIPDQPPPPPFHNLGSSPPSSSSGTSLSAGTFFKNLLPRGLDTEDLIVVLLLLLMGQDGGKDGKKALLTLGAYLFL